MLSRDHVRIRMRRTVGGYCCRRIERSVRLDVMPWSVSAPSGVAPVRSGERAGTMNGVHTQPRPISIASDISSGIRVLPATCSNRWPDL